VYKGQSLNQQHRNDGSENASWWRRTCCVPKPGAPLQVNRPRSGSVWHPHRLTGSAVAVTTAWQSVLTAQRAHQDLWTGSVQDRIAGGNPTSAEAVTAVQSNDWWLLAAGLLEQDMRTSTCWL